MSALPLKADISWASDDVGVGRAYPPPILDVDLLGDCQSIIDFNPKITNSALDFSVTKKQLYRSQITRASIDRCRLGSAQ